jgi:hypothetical protein
MRSVLELVNRTEVVSVVDLSKVTVHSSSDPIVTGLGLQLIATGFTSDLGWLLRAKVLVTPSNSALIVTAALLLGDDTTRKVAVAASAGTSTDTGAENPRCPL